MAGVRVKVKIDSLHRFNLEVQKGFSGVAGGSIGSGPFEDMRRQWAERYSAFTSRRFSQFSTGGGDWPPLALSTVKARRGPDKSRARSIKKDPTKLALGSASSLARDTRKGGHLVAAGGRRVAILVNTGILKNAVAIGGAGNSVKRTPGGITYGFNKMPHVGKGKMPSIGTLAAYHHFGKGHNPKRPILVYPPSNVVSGMVSDADRAIKRAIAGGGA